MSDRSVMFVAGDPSGDKHASAIIETLHRQSPDLHCFGIGGPHMQNAGFEAVMPFEPFNRMGFVEVAIHILFFLKAKRNLVRLIEARRPGAIVCVDYPGFNILLMKAASRRGVPVVWYIVPQVWAWKKKRTAVLARHAAFIGTVFPFEVDLFRTYTQSVEFVGHPLVESMQGVPKRDFGDAKNRHARGQLRLVMLPGSREQEVGRILDTMVEAFGLLRQRFPDMRATVSRMGHLPNKLYSGIESDPGIDLSDQPLDELLPRCDLAFVTSGTATLQTALHQVPMVIVYRTSAVTFRIMRSVVFLSNIGLPNIVAGRKVVPELVQGDATGGKLADAALPLVESSERYMSTVKDLGTLRDRLGNMRPSVLMAERILGVLQQGCP